MFREFETIFDDSDGYYVDNVTGDVQQARTMLAKARIDQCKVVITC